MMETQQTVFSSYTCADILSCSLQTQIRYSYLWRLKRTYFYTVNPLGTTSSVMCKIPLSKN